ncbi:hypothetical protein H5T87_04445, partial [bacterium]|nr:hypothetical protein [bacterium]
MNKINFLVCFLSSIFFLWGEIYIRDYSSPARWIWGTNRSPYGEKGFFRKTFQIQKQLKSAYIQMTGDDAFTLFVNGRKVGSGGFSFNSLHIYLITDFLRIGKNIIAIEDYSPADPAGVIV